MNIKDKGIIMRRSAFTMLELVFVIVVLGIIAAMAIPRMEHDTRQQASEHILSAFQTTRYMALIDNRTNPDDSNWQRELWNIRFLADGNGGFFYTISSNANQDDTVDKNETALDATNGKYMYNQFNTNTIDSDESKSIFIGQNYGINSVVFAGGCANSDYIAFDYLGRPFASGIYVNALVPMVLYSNVMTSACTITFGFQDATLNDLVYMIEPETGHVSLL
jgi:prepilin-type N-terminal cleavage/methylation domain-containing protein